jgi:hypothetical protein
MPCNLKNVPHMVDFFSVLGYPKGEFLKEHIALDKQISAFFNKYVAGKGLIPPVPYKWLSPGEEMATLAAEFLREDGCGERFWPEQKPTSESKLQWPRDEKKSVTILSINPFMLMSTLLGSRITSLSSFVEGQHCLHWSMPKIRKADS